MLDNVQVASAHPAPSLSFEQAALMLRCCLDAGGPAPENYAELHAVFDTIAAARRRAELDDRQHAALVDLLGPAASRASLLGRIIHRPHGAPDAFDLLDRLAVGSCSPDPAIAPWDAYIQSLPIARATRRRVAHFGHLVRRLCESRAPGAYGAGGAGPARILLAGCGPAREVRELLDREPGLTAKFTCVDSDPAAIAHARELLRPHRPLVALLGENPIRLDLGRKFDLVWAGHLFDRVAPKAFVALISRLVDHLAPGGYLVAGMLAAPEQARGVMEFMNWRPVHRSTDELKFLTSQANLKPWCTALDLDPEGIAPFLCVRPDSLA